MTDNPERRSAVFARKVRELRESHGWSQAELGRQLGEYGHKLGQSRVAAIEATGSATIDQADAFAAALGVPVEVLLYEQPPLASGVYIRQIQRLNKIGNAVWDHREEVNRLTAEILAELPGTLPPNVVVTADSVIDLPPLAESE
jgi:transcriptional regulator with XRE-family HTH domain